MEATSRTRTSPAELSIVIASVNGWEVLGPTLAAIDALPERDRIEVVVVETVGETTREQLHAHTRPILMIPSDRLPIPRLRYRGIAQASGRLIAVIEDHAAVDRDWAAALLNAHDGPWGAVAGAVENGVDGFVNWAVFFCEYAPFMRPVAEGEYADLPGNNIAYKRPDLLKHAQVLDEGKWESWINEKLRVDGVPIASTNAMVVRHIKRFGIAYFLAQRFHFARSYAGMRRCDQSWPIRLVYAAGSLALPALLTVRVTKTVLAKRRHLAKFAMVWPLVALFMTVGAVGEMLGYLAGSGQSLDRVE